MIVMFSGVEVGIMVDFDVVVWLCIILVLEEMILNVVYNYIVYDQGIYEEVMGINILVIILQNMVVIVIV